MAQSAAINRRSRCGSVRGWPVLSSHFFPGAAPQVGQGTASTCFGPSFFSWRGEMMPQKQCTRMVNLEHFNALTGNSQTSWVPRGALEQALQRVRRSDQDAVTPSRPTQTGTLCGEPSGMRVARWAKLGPSSKALISLKSGIATTTVLARKCQSKSITSICAGVGIT